MTPDPLLPDDGASTGATPGAIGVYCHAASAVATGGANGVDRCPVALDLGLFLLGPLANRAEDHDIEHFPLALGDRRAVGTQAVQERRNLRGGGFGRHDCLPVHLVLGGGATRAGGAAMPAAKSLRLVVISADMQLTRCTIRARYLQGGIFRVP